MLTFSLPRNASEQVIYCESCNQPIVIDTGFEATSRPCPSCGEIVQHKIQRPLYLPPYMLVLLVMVLVLTLAATVVIPSAHPYHRAAQVAMGMSLAVMALVARMLLKARTERLDVLGWVVTGALEAAGIIVIVRDFI